MDAATALEAGGEYRVLRKLGRRRQFCAADGTPNKIGIVLDTRPPASIRSATRSSSSAWSFIFSAVGRVFDVVEELSALREPSVPIPSAVTELTGIDANMMVGQRIDVGQVERFIADTVLVIAHGAAFDGPFCEARVSRERHGR